LTDDEDTERNPDAATKTPSVDTNKAFFNGLTARVNALSRTLTPEKAPVKDQASFSQAPADASLVLEIKGEEWVGPASPRLHFSF